MKKIRGAIASYKNADKENVCDLDWLCQHFEKNLGNIPERISFIAAAELRLLALAYLYYRKKDGTKWPLKKYKEDKWK